MPKSGLIERVGKQALIFEQAFKNIDDVGGLQEIMGEIAALEVEGAKVLSAIRKLP